MKKVEVKRQARSIIQWPDHLIRLLGNVPDRVVAKRARVHLETVKDERRRRGIAACCPKRPPIEWTDAMLALLGADTDANVAAELGIGIGSVSSKRRHLGIEPWGRSTLPKVSFWTPRREALLGTDTDRKVAQRLRVTRERVAARRRTLGIPPFEQKALPVRWTEEMLRWLGQASDKEVAARLGIGAKAVRAERLRRKIAPKHEEKVSLVRDRRMMAALKLPTPQAIEQLGISREAIHTLRGEFGVPEPGPPTIWTPKALARLGKVADEVLAAQLGVKPETVARKRVEMGLRRRENYRWTPEQDALVGTAPDKEVARWLGRTLKAVRHRRLGLKTRPGAEPDRRPKKT